MQRRRSLPVRLALVGGLLVIIVTSVGTPLPLAAATPDEAMEAQYAKFAHIEAAADEVRKIQPELLNDKKYNFAGAWVDEDGNPHLATAHGDNGIRQMAQEALSRTPIFHEFALTLDHMVAAKDTISAKARAAGWTLGGAEVSTIGTDVTTNRIVIELVRPTAYQLATVATRFGDVADVAGVDERSAWRQYKANLYGRGGDSGSPIFYGTKAHGIAVGNDCDGCSALYYTPAKRVEEFWSNEFMVLTYQP